MNWWFLLFISVGINIDSWVLAGGGDRGGDKPERKRLTNAVSTDKKSKKQRTSEELQHDFSVGNVNTDNTYLQPTEHMASNALSSSLQADLIDDTITRPSQQYYRGDQDIDEEEQIHQFMTSLQSLRDVHESEGSTACSYSSVGGVLEPSDPSLATWVPSLTATSDPMRLRLRSLRNSDVVSGSSSGLDTAVTWTTDGRAQRSVLGNQYGIPSLPTLPAVTTQTQYQADLTALDQRMDGLQQMLTQLISTVIPLVQDNLRERNQRLGPDVRLRTDSTTVINDALRQIPMTNAHTLQATTLPLQTSTAASQRQAGQQRLHHRQQQQQTLQTQQLPQRATLPLTARQLPTDGQRFSSGDGLQSVLPWSLPLTSQSPSTSVSHAIGAPPLDKRIMLAVERGEYVNFNSILSSTSFDIALTEDNDDERPFSVTMGRDEGGRSVLDFKQRSAGRSKVKDFQSWSVAFTWYMRAVTCYHAHLLPHLVQYQGIITRFANQYAPSAWLNYDRAFRRRVAMSPETPWHVVDEEIFSIYLRAAPIAASLRASSWSWSSSSQVSGRDRCYRCRGIGHRARQCPSNLQAALTSTHAAAHTSALTIVPPRRPVTTAARLPVSGTQSLSGRAGFCFAFNDGHCPRGGQCSYRHVCGNCGLAGHTTNTCTQPPRGDRG